MCSLTGNGQGRIILKEGTGKVRKSITPKGGTSARVGLCLTDCYHYDLLVSFRNLHLIFKKFERLQFTEFIIYVFFVGRRTKTAKMKWFSFGPEEGWENKIRIFFVSFSGFSFQCHSVVPPSHIFFFPFFLFLFFSIFTVPSTLIPFPSIVATDLRGAGSFSYGRNQINVRQSSKNILVLN